MGHHPLLPAPRAGAAHGDLQEAFPYVTKRDRSSLKSAHSSALCRQGRLVGSLTRALAERLIWAPSARCPDICVLLSGRGGSGPLTPACAASRRSRCPPAAPTGIACTAAATATPTAPVAHGPGPHTLPPAHQGLRRPEDRRRQDQQRDPVLPQALHRPRDLSCLPSSASLGGAAAVRRSAGCSHLRGSARWLRPWRSPRRLACPPMR